jgi:DNA-directed RNA polymerase subunit omega
VEENRVLDELKEEGIVNKVGGRFKLSTLIQKRIVMLNHGARALVEGRDAKGPDKMSIVLQEILNGRIYLDMSGNVRVRGEEDRPLLSDNSVMTE